MVKQAQQGDNKDIVECESIQHKEEANRTCQQRTRHSSEKVVLQKQPIKRTATARCWEVAAKVGVRRCQEVAAAAKEI